MFFNFFENLTKNAQRKKKATPRGDRPVKNFRVETLEERQMLALTEISDFPGIEQIDAIQPAHASSAVGPNILVGMVNSHISLFEKDGEQIDITSFHEVLDLPTFDDQFGFFDSVDLDLGLIANPWATFDQYSDRFIVAASEVTVPVPLFGQIVIGISTSDSPDDLDAGQFDADNDWDFLAIPGTFIFTGPPAAGPPPIPPPGGTGLSGVLREDLRVAADEDHIYVTGNYLTPNGTHAGVAVTVLDKADALDGVVTVLGTIEALDLDARSLIPVESVGRQATDPMLFVDETDEGIRVWEMDITDPNLPLVIRTVIDSPHEARDRATGVPQLNTLTTLDAVSAELRNAVWRDGSLWTAHTVQVGGITGDATVRWYEITHNPDGSYEAATGFVAASPQLDGPTGAVYGPDGNLYVASANNNSVVRYDPVDGTEIDVFVAAGSGGLTDARDLAFGPDGNLYVSSFQTNEVLRYDGATGAFIDAFVDTNIDGPRGLFFNPVNQLLYVASENDDAVHRFDDTGAFVDTFITSGSSGLDAPVGLATGPDNNLYVASSGTNAILRYNATNGQFFNEFVAAGDGGLDGPANFVFRQDGLLYVASSGSDAVLRYDALTGTFVDEFVEPGAGGLDNPIGVLFDGSGNFYVTSFDTDEVITSIRSGSFEFVDEFVATGLGGLSGPSGGVFGPDGNLYVASERNDSILRYDPTGGSLLGTFVPSGSGGLDQPTALTFGPDGNLYVSSFGTDEVLRYQGATGIFMGAFVTTDIVGPRGLLFDPDPTINLLYVASEGDDAVHSFSDTTGAFVNTVITTGDGGLDDPYDLEIGPDGNAYVSSSATNEILRFDPTAGPPWTIIDDFISAGNGGLVGPTNFEFRPDGLLYVASSGGDAILSFDDTTGNFVEVIVGRGDGGLDHPADVFFDPNGVLYVSSFDTDAILRFERYSLRQQGDINPGLGIHTFVPVITVDAFGNMGITFTQSSETQFPAMMVDGREDTDPLGTTNGAQVVQAGLTFYETTGGVETWGAYAGIGVDPVDGRTFYAFHEVPNFNLTRWTTHWSQFRVEPFPAEIEIRGNGLEIVDGDITPEAIDRTDFGDVNLGSQVVHTLAIHNLGDLDLNLTGVPVITITQLSGADVDFTVTQPDFVLAGFPDGIVPGLDSINFDLTYRPTTVGEDVFEVSIASNDSDENPYTFEIRGNGISVPEIVVEGNNVAIGAGDTTPRLSDHTNFGVVRASGTSSVTRLFTIKNIGATDPGSPKLNVSEIELIQSGSDFTLILEEPNFPGPAAAFGLPVNLSGGEEQSFFVSFDPTQVGTATATIRITNTDGDEGIYEYVIEGEGAVDFLDFGDAPDTSFDNPRETAPAFFDFPGFNYGIAGHPTPLTGPALGGNADPQGGFPDLENVTQLFDGNDDPILDASGDDNDQTADENGVIFGTGAKLSIAQTNDVQVELTGPGNSTAFVNIWIDFDQDGLFDEQVIDDFQVTLSPQGEAEVNFPVFVPASNLADATGSYFTFARVRVSSQQGVQSSGVAFDGEVEDYHVEIVLNKDYSDAPITEYGFASHTITGVDPVLGARVDGEPEPFDSSKADQDDLTEFDDEDGVLFPIIEAGTGLPVFFAGLVTSTTISLNPTADGLLFAWVDFDGENGFDPLTELVTPDTGMLLLANTTNQVNIPTPTDAQRGETFVRFRIVGVGEANPGPVSEVFGGEVEDYQITISSTFDFGDAPDNPNDPFVDYPTLLTSGARHAILSGAPRLGLQIDPEADGLQSVDATGDGADDDGVVFLTDAIPGAGIELVPGQMATVRVQITSAVGHVHAWLDSNLDGDFDLKVIDLGKPGDEFINIRDISFLVPPTVTPGKNFLRVRVVSPQVNGPGIEPFGFLADGEVEDYVVNIVAFDYGDLPDDGTSAPGPFRTTDANDGPRHALRNLHLGATVDQDPDGFASPDALGDDRNGSDDEDGVFHVTGEPFGILPLGIGQTAAFDVFVNGQQGLLDAWVDLNGDGSFDGFLDASTGLPISEHIVDSIADVNGDGIKDGSVNPGVANRFEFDVPSLPSGVVVGNTFARFRLSTAGGLGHNGFAADGEVEDYQLLINGPTGPFDLGDAPDAPDTLIVDINNPLVRTTRLSRNGPFHLVTGSGPILGNLIDAETPDLKPIGFGTEFEFTGFEDDNDGFDDEDGVEFTSTIIEGLDMNYTVTVTQADGLVDAFADFNNDGIFESQLLNRALVRRDESRAFSFRVPTNIDPSQPNRVTLNEPLTMRFRVSTAGDLSPSGIALDGEVEDHMIVVQPGIVADFGDAPDPGPGTGPGNYRTTATDNGPQHAPALWRLGRKASSFATDSARGVFNNGTPVNHLEISGFTQSPDASGDDVNGFDDEDEGGVTFNLDGLPGVGPLELFVGQETTLEFWVHDPRNPTPADAPYAVYAHAWIDFNFDGEFDMQLADNALRVLFEPNPCPLIECNFRTITDTAGDNGEEEVQVTFDVPDNAVPGNTILRMRVVRLDEISNDFNLKSFDLKEDIPAGGPRPGEVEDHFITILGLDFGDAPDPTVGIGTADYQTIVRQGDLNDGNSGPSHALRPDGPILGFRVDLDPFAQEGASALGDDDDGVTGGFPNDEDGVEFDNLIGGQPGEITVQVTNVTGTDRVNAWIDFNADGDFLDPFEQVVTNLAFNNDGTQQVTFPVPGNAIVGTSYARVRVSSTAGLSPTGYANDGEVEDYQVLLGGLDFGDAPDNALDSNPDYPTLLVNNDPRDPDSGPSHLIGGPRLGVGQPDAEADATQSAGALGDDIRGIDDENGVNFPKALNVGLLIGDAFDLIVSNEPGKVDAWIDFNQDGDFDDLLDGPLGANTISEHVLISDSDPNATFDLNDLGLQRRFDVQVPDNAIIGDTFARFRVSSLGTPQPTGFATDGEVEDHIVTITGIDFGDAPDTYGTTLSNLLKPGARHFVDGKAGPILGDFVDAEPDAAQPFDGTGDDVTNIPDEEGITFDNLRLFAGQATVVNVKVTNDDGFVSGWIDFNGDGDFEDIVDGISEQIITNARIVANSTATTPFSFEVPANSTPGKTYARFRVSTNPGLGPFGPDVSEVLPDGEVEDYEVTIDALDFGDAPESYGTLVGDDGARHGAIGPRLGALRDNEIEANPNAADEYDATGDDVTGIDDEDGITLPVEMVIGQSEVITVNIQGLDPDTAPSAVVQGWIDFNRNGVFDTSELVVNRIRTREGDFSFTVTPPGGSIGSTFARFRISTGGGLGPTGIAQNGEVEDYEVIVISDRLSNPIIDMEGQSFTGIDPADPSGDVGPDHYVQAVNHPQGSQITIYDKRGSIVDGPFIMRTLGANNGNGQATVLYDHLADRWLLMESRVNNLGVNLYVSRTPTPTSNAADWLLTALNTPNLELPKVAVWPEAYFITGGETNANGDVDPVVYALDRTNLLLGNALRPQIRQVAPRLDGFNFQTLTPADLDGEAPPAGEPAVFARHRDDEAHSPGQNVDVNDFLDIFEFFPDFDNPNLSIFGQITSIPISEIDSDLGGLTNNSVFGQAGGTPLDPIREPITWRLAYRNFTNGTLDDATPHQALVGSFVHDISGTDQGGIRWFELSRTVTTQWRVKQEGDVSFGNDNRFLGSMAMDGNGNIVMGYNVTGDNTSPSLRYIGRKATDPQGAMTTFEQRLVDGVGTVPSNEFGRYTSMSVDPSDDLTFWFTGAFADGNQWSTQIAAFAFGLEPGVAISEGEDGILVTEDGLTDTYTVSLTTEPIGPVEVTITSADGQVMLSSDAGANFSPQLVLTLTDTSIQTITVLAVDDRDFEFGRHIGFITHEITSSGDPDYPQVQLLDATATIEDNDILVSPLVGVDFEGGSDTPRNWTPIPTSATPTSFNDLIDEAGNVTGFDLDVSNLSGSFTTNQFPIAPNTLPQHIQSLNGLNGTALFAANGDTATFIWNDLVAGLDYNIWVFGLNNTASTQDVTITDGAGATVFTQSLSADELIINNEVGDDNRDLKSFARVATADATGRITIDVTSATAVSVAGLAISELVPEFDYGDAPTAGQSGFANSYPTRIVDGGASHELGGPILGELVDSEPDGTPTAAADGDDVPVPDDEDGIAFTSPLIPGQSATVDVTIQGTGELDAWIDFNQNGIWEANEQISLSTEVTSSIPRLFATNRDGLENELIEIDPDTGDVIRTFPTVLINGEQQTVAVLSGLEFDGTSLWYIEGSGGLPTGNEAVPHDRLYRIDPDTGEVLNGGGIGIDLSADPFFTNLNLPNPFDLIFDGMAFLNDRLYIQEQITDRIYVFNPLTELIENAIVPGQALDGGLGAISDPDGAGDALVATDSANNKVYLINPVTGIIESDFDTPANIVSNTGVAVFDNEIFLADLDEDITVVNRQGVVQRTISINPALGTSSVSIRSIGGGVGQIDGSVVQPLSFQVPADAIPGTTYARFRVSTDGGLLPGGPAVDGEVEDYQVEIVGGAPRADAIGVRRSNLVFQDVTGDGTWNVGDSVARFGIDGDTPISGDWNGDGFDEVGVHRGNFFYLDVSGDGRWGAGDAVYRFGNIGDTPIVGDWDGNGTDDIGIHRDNFFFLDFTGDGRWNIGDVVYRFGIIGDVPVIGDWDGNGTDNIGIHRDNLFFLDASGNGAWSAGDTVYRFGNPTGDMPLIGDWDGDGTDNIGVQRGRDFFLDQNGDGSWSGASDRFYHFGIASDTGVAGRWKAPSPLTASAGEANPADTNAKALTSEELAPIVSAAADILADQGLTEAQSEKLAQLNVRLADLNGALLGQALGNSITIDSNAAGHGWFVDRTPNANEEFKVTANRGLVAAGDSAAAGQVDLLSVVLHEMGHVLGLDHDDANGVMGERLDNGVRRLPTEGDLAAVLAGDELDALFS